MATVAGWEQRAVIIRGVIIEVIYRTHHRFIIGKWPQRHVNNDANRAMWGGTHENNGGVDCRDLSINTGRTIRQ